MSKQTTATEWLFKQLWDTPKDKLTWYALLKEANKMFEQQIIDAYKYGVKDEYVIGAKQYYNEAFGSHNSTNNSD